MSIITVLIEMGPIRVRNMSGSTQIFRSSRHLKINRFILFINLLPANSSSNFTKIGSGARIRLKLYSFSANQKKPET